MDGGQRTSTQTDVLHSDLAPAPVFRFARRASPPPFSPPRELSRLPPAWDPGAPGPHGGRGLQVAAEAFEEPGPAHFFKIN